MRQTETRGALYGTSEEAHSEADREPARQVEAGVANGKTLPQTCKEVEIVEQTYYRVGVNDADLAAIQLDQKAVCEDKVNAIGIQDLLMSCCAGKEGALCPATLTSSV